MVNEGGFANASGAVKKEELRDAVVLHVVVEDGFNGSLVEFMVLQTENLHAQVITILRQKI